MQLVLRQLSKRVGRETWIHTLDMELAEHAVTVLLGATRAGKTTLMRLMAGLDRPTAGQVLVDGQDVTGVPVRRRDVAMVYQQFINYPSLTVAENIAAPLRLRRTPRAEIAARVAELAGRLHIEPYLKRLPGELSGGQQQRVALARALAKRAPLVLLDEPLVNLDYKLREELREDLTQLFERGESTVVYATTEPAEALLLGGHTAVLYEGRLLQYGPTAQVFRRPASIEVARSFSDPPMNLLPAQRAEGGVRLSGGDLLPLALPGDTGGSGELTVGIRADGLRARAVPGSVALAGRVQLSEFAGSDTYLHVETAAGRLVAQWRGIQRLQPGDAVTLHLDAGSAYAFDSVGALLHAPRSAAGTPAEAA